MAGPISSLAYAAVTFSMLSYNIHGISWLFAKDNPQFRLVACVVDAKEVYGADGIKQLATLPGRQELRAQLLALINTPATQLVRLINTPAGQVARAIDARREKLEGGAI